MRACFGKGRPGWPPRVMLLFRFFKITCLVLSLSLAPWRAAQAEVDLGTWNTYATMAEQGAVCGAFADIMAMQELVDAKLGRLWAERRNYAGSVVRRAAELEGRAEIDDAAIDDLLARYSMWLLNNLAAEENAEILSGDARDAARDMIADVCNALYQQADRAIVVKHPALASCTPAGTDTQTPLPLSPSATPADTAGTSAQCDVNEALLAAATAKKAEQDVADMLLRLREEEERRRKAQEQAETLQSQMAGLKSELDALEIGAEAARDTAARAVELNMTNDKMRDRIASLGDEIVRLNELVTEMNAVTTRNSELLAETDSLNKRVADLQTRLDSAQSEIALLHTPAELDAARKRIDDLTTELDRTRGERDDAVAAIDTALSSTVIASPMIEDQTATTPVAVTASVASADAADEGAIADDMTLLDTDLDTGAVAGLALTSEESAPSASPDASIADQLVQTTAEPSFVVQLGAFKSRTGAITEIATLQENFPDQLAASGLNIDADRMADGGSMFRIMTGSMTADAARDLCGLLWQRMVGCMVKMVP